MTRSRAMFDYDFVDKLTDHDENENLKYFIFLFRIHYNNQTTPTSRKEKSTKYSNQSQDTAINPKTRP